jgi:hypothetical protein
MLHSSLTLQVSRSDSVLQWGIFISGSRQQKQQLKDMLVSEKGVKVAHDRATMMLLVPNSTGDFYSIS